MGEPSITRQAAHVSSGSNLPVRRVVIHATCPDVGYPMASARGTASGTAKYFQMATSGGSAHYVEGIDREEHCVRESAIAWHAPPNPHSVGIEITADGGAAGAFRVAAHAYTREQWLSDRVWPAVVRAAERTRDICERHGIPKRLLTVTQVRADAEGICGHVHVSEAFGQSTHSDPGPNFPWDRFMAIVNGEDSDMPLNDADKAFIVDAIAKGVAAGVAATASAVWHAKLTNSHDKTTAQAAAYLVYGNEAAHQAGDAAQAAQRAIGTVAAQAANAAAAATAQALKDKVITVDVNVNGAGQ